MHLTDHFSTCTSVATTSRADKIQRLESQRSWSECPFVRRQFELRMAMKTDHAEMPRVRSFTLNASNYLTLLRYHLCYGAASAPSLSRSHSCPVLPEHNSEVSGGYQAQRAPDPSYIHMISSMEFRKTSATGSTTKQSNGTEGRQLAPTQSNIPTSQVIEESC